MPLRWTRRDASRPRSGRDLHGGRRRADHEPARSRGAQSRHLDAPLRRGRSSAPGDPFVGASLRGRAPGWPDTDLEIVDDNNKAQRNMGLSTVAGARVSWGSPFCGVSYTTPRLCRRDLELHIRWPIPRNAQGRPAAGDRASRGEEPMPIRDDGRIVLRRMEPLENRWVGVRVRGMRRKARSRRRRRIRRNGRRTPRSTGSPSVSCSDPTERSKRTRANDCGRSRRAWSYGWNADLGDAAGRSWRVARGSQFPTACCLDRQDRQAGARPQGRTSSASTRRSCLPTRGEERRGAARLRRADLADGDRRRAAHVAAAGAGELAPTCCRPCGGSWPSSKRRMALPSKPPWTNRAQMPPVRRGLGSAQGEPERCGGPRAQDARAGGDSRQQEHAAGSAAPRRGVPGSKQGPGPVSGQTRGARPGARVRAQTPATA